MLGNLRLIDFPRSSLRTSEAARAIILACVVARHVRGHENSVRFPQKTWVCSIGPTARFNRRQNTEAIPTASLLNRNLNCGIVGRRSDGIHEAVSHDEDLVRRVEMQHCADITG